MGINGAHMAATLYRLSKTKQLETEVDEREPTESSSARVYAQLSNRLTELIDDVRDVSVDYDEKRELLTVMLTEKDGTPHSARSLSDGTIRFLALGVLELDTESSGLICLEEPENGIHPERIPAMLDLLEDIATDVNEPIGQDNPLRQVIINTHSPSVVAQIPDESLLVAERSEMIKDDLRFKVVHFSCLPGNWRLKADDKPLVVSRGKLLAYLNPIEFAGQTPQDDLEYKKKSGNIRKRRVIDRSDIQQMFAFDEES
jgi:predicted ATPase